MLSMASLYSQGSFIICDTTEFCICHDGSEELFYYTFNTCVPGHSIYLAFCGGDVPENLLATIFNGPNAGAPIFETLGSPGPWDGSSYMSTDPSGGLSVRWYFTFASELSCANGDLGPIVFYVFSAPIQPPLPPPLTWVDCTNIGSSCLPTSLGDTSPSSAPHVTYAQSALHFPRVGFHGEVEIRDLSGRIIDELRANGEEQLILRSSLPSGLYVVVLRSPSGTASRPIAVP
jgi:hypothetical protein